MPVHWTISHSARLVVAVARDEVSVADIERYFAGITADDAMGYAKIFEITHSPLALNDDNLKSLGQRVMFYARHGQVGPLAIVAASDESFAQAEIFAAAARVDRPLRIFRELHAARRCWTNKPAGLQPDAICNVDSLRGGHSIRISMPTDKDRVPFSNTQTDAARYRLLVEQVIDYAICMLDPSGIVSSWNRGAERFKGYRPDEIIGQHFSRFYTDEDRAAGVPERALRTATAEGRFEAEGWRVRKDGSRFWAGVVIDAIRDGDQLVGFAKVTRDLTERKAADDRLRQSEEQFRRLIQGVTDYAIYMLDPEGRVTNWNPGAQRIKGYRPEEIVGQHFSRFYTEEDRAADVPRRALAQATETGRFQAEGWRVRKDGTRFWAMVAIDAIRDDDGKLVGFAKVTRDITERRDTQIALEQAREQLFQSQKMEALGRLTGGIAHDFNNLLAAIIGGLDLALKQVNEGRFETPRLRALLDNAQQAAQRGAWLTQRMLAFARRQDLSLTAVDLGSLIGGMEHLLRQSLGPTINLSIQIPRSLPAVRTDAHQFEMALLNLAMNARDAMPAGGTITISACAETITRGPPEPGPYVCLTVKDEGEGMDEATLARATEPFFTTKGAGKGTGLGLSLVHGTVEQSGGRFALRSIKGQGTSAELWLPVDAAAAQQEAASSAAPEASVRQLTVLAVDDDALVLMNTVAMLEDLGHKVFAASSGQRALEILGREKAMDLLITDHAMPRMTGAELAAKVKEKWPQLPIVVATGYAELHDTSLAGSERLDKPFRQQDLAQVISRALEKA